MPREYVCEVCGDAFLGRPDRPRLFCGRACAAVGRKPLIAPWFDRIDRSGGPNACWEWPGADNGAGYGYVRIGGKSFLVHRLSYERVNGRVPDGLLVLHSCDNRRCCNPAHLRVGDYADNMRDAVERGRHRPGKRLTQEQADEIRALRAEGMTLGPLARRFGVSDSTVWAILTNKRYVTEKEATTA